MRYADIDTILQPWAVRRSLSICTTFKDEEARIILVVDDAGDTYHLYTGPDPKEPSYPDTRLALVAVSNRGIGVSQQILTRFSLEARSLVGWLNGLPEVQAVLAKQFGGLPIREQNLSEWRKRGYRDWELKQEALELSVRLYRASSAPRSASHPDHTEIAPQIRAEFDWNPGAGAI